MKLISKSGTASLRIVFKGIGDGPVVFQAANLGGGNYCDRAIILDASDYVTIGGTGQHEGFIFRGDFDYNRLGQEIDFGTVAVVGAYRSSPTCSSYAKILGNTFEGTTEASLVGETSSEIHFWRASADDCREGAEVAYNNITWRAAQSALGFPDGSSACCSDNGFCEVPASPMQIHHNTMVWNSAHGSYRSNSIGARGLSDVQIYNNWIQNGTPAMQTTQSQTILIRDSKRVSIYNNYIQAYGATNLIYLQHGCYPEATAGVTNESYRIYNNTFYGSADGILLENVQGSEFRNNIFLGSSSQSSADLANAYGKGDFAGPASSGNSFGYTLFHNVNSPWGKSASCAAEFGAASCDPDSTNVYANPVIVGSGAPPVPFFQLQAGSPAIDAGFAGPATPLIDYDGENRGSSPDIGADERGLLLLLPPQNLRIVPPR